MQYSLHAKWQGVWEIRGNSRWNGDRMVIMFIDDKCTLTEASTLEEYTLTSEPQSNLKAHWDFRSSGKAKRYYIGTLSHTKNYREIEWSEMRKNRKTDKWIRVDLDPIQYLKQCKFRKSKYKTNTSHKLIAKHPHPNQNLHQHQHQHPSHSHSNYNPQQNNNNHHNSSKYVKKQANNNNSIKTINDPAILNMKPYKYQTEHKPHKNNQFYVEYYPKPRRTVLRHDQVHQPRYKRNQQRYNNNNNNNQRNKPAIIDAYLEKNPHAKKSKNNNEWKPKRRRRNRNRFCPHLTKQEVDQILTDTKSFSNPVLYIGEISVSRFNPNISYVRVDGFERDIRISGFIDRNRAFHGDMVVISLYPEIEWMSAIKPELLQFQNRLDERDKLNTTNTINTCQIETEEDDEVDVEDVDDGYNASSSSSSSASSQNNNNNRFGEKILPASPDDDDNDEEPEIIFFDDIDSENNNNNEQKKTKKKEKIIPKKDKISRRGRLEELVDKKSITGYDEYLFLCDMVSDFNRFSEKWPDLDLFDTNHPRRDYIDKVINKCDGQLPQQALSIFTSLPFDLNNAKIARGKVLCIYTPKKGAKNCIPGYLLPIRYHDSGEVNVQWAEFTPADKRYPKARLPMRELPVSVKDLFYKYEKEEIEIVQEYENRKYDLRRQKQEEHSHKIKKRNNIYMDELKLMFFTMSFEHKWYAHNMQPICHFKQELGRRGAIDVETNVILSRHNISWRSSFTSQIEDYVVNNCVIDEKDYINRRDCRDMRVFSIDPTSARDFDDALSISDLNEFDCGGKKLYLIGIHIADVSHFLDKNVGNIVDTEAAFRATSVYLVDRCLPMLPHHLCQNLCSLNPDVDRLAYSVFVVLNEEGHLVKRSGDGKYDQSPWFGRTVIRSRARLNYETAHWMLTKQKVLDISNLDKCCFISDQVSLDEISSDVQLFWSIAKQMRCRRFASGSVQFFRPKIRFRLSENKKRALVFGPEILLLSNNLIEEMMLLANQLVANKLISCIKPHTLLRRHPSPLQEKGIKLQLICRSQGMDLKYDTPQHLNESLIEMEKVLYGDTSAAKIINAQLAQSMMRAEYIIVEDKTPAEWRHWALNFPFYTHFTSPIRRYADVMVHRLLTYTISSEQERASLPLISDMKKQCKVCNERNAAAHFAEIDSQTIHLCLLLIDKPIIVDAMLIDIIGHSLFILVIPGLGIDVRVNIKDTISESKGKIKSISKEFELPDTQLIIKWQSGECEEYKLFDTIRIRLYSKLKIPIKLFTEIIDPYARKYAIPANLQEECKESQEKEEEKIENNEEIIDDNNEVSAVAMTLDSQLKIGTADFYAAHYD